MELPADIAKRFLAGVQPGTTSYTGTRISPYAGYFQNMKETPTLRPCAANDVPARDDLMKGFVSRLYPVPPPPPFQPPASVDMDDGA